jgi:hypothetical protein
MARADEIYDLLKRANEALHNVPCVGDVYDQQHSDTHFGMSQEICEMIEDIDQAAGIEHPEPR